MKNETKDKAIRLIIKHQGSFIDAIEAVIEENEALKAELVTCKHDLSAVNAMLSEINKPE